MEELLTTTYSCLCIAKTYGNTSMDAPADVDVELLLISMLLVLMLVLILMLV